VDDRERSVAESGEASSGVVATGPSGAAPSVWGRDELAAGEMWNSNSVVAWLLVVSGLSAEAVSPPRSGRAPGWNAGVVVARREAGP
jgi:hypothetical protein